jgi:L-ascorbate metabolism protein UlaG (beta-lactamase superfamily)
MKIKWLGHACFLITSNSGIRIVTDPYKADYALAYDEIKESADIVTVSHEHFDHNNTRVIMGKPLMVRKSAEAKGLNFKSIDTFHDGMGGRERGSNTLFCFTVDAINICHCGDLGHIPSDKQCAEIGSVDVLLIPVGGFFTLEPYQVDQFVGKINPRLVIPMHYKTSKSSKMPFAGVENFIAGKKNVMNINKSEIELQMGTLPASTQIMVLLPAL